MSHWWTVTDCGCKVYVEATLCGGEEDPGYKLYVHENNLPQSIFYFLYDGVCWKIDPTDEKICVEGTQFIEGSGATTSVLGKTLVDTGAFEGLYLVAAVCQVTETNGGILGFYTIESSTDDALVFYENPGDGTAVSYLICACIKAHIVVPSFDYGSCSACVGRGDDSDESIGRDWTNCGDGVGGGGGGGGPGAYPEGNGTSEWKEASVCTANAGWENVCDDIFVPAHQVEEDMWFRYYGICYEVLEATEITDRDDLPEDPCLVNVKGEYEDCDECTKGVKAELCPDQENPENAREVWIPSGSLPDIAVDRIFRYQNYCYEINTNDTLATISEGASILDYVPSDYLNCNDCKLGIKAILCQDQTSPNYDVYVSGKNLPAVITYFKYKGFCYKIVPGPEFLIPSDSEIAILPDNIQYNDCEACLCGLINEGSEDFGSRCLVCGGQGAPGEDLWVKESDIPTEYSVFRRNGVCYYIGPSSPLCNLPEDALLIQPHKEYETCNGCMNKPDEQLPPPTNPDEDDDGGFFPPPPPPPPPPPEETLLDRFVDCETHAPKDTYTPAGSYPFPIAISPKENVSDLLASECYYTIPGIVIVGDVPAGTITSFEKDVFDDCDDCIASYKLTPCLANGICDCDAGGGIDITEPLTVTFSGIEACGACNPTLPPAVCAFVSATPNCTFTSATQENVCTDPDVDTVYSVFINDSTGVMFVSVPSPNRYFEGTHVLTEEECLAGEVTIQSDFLVPCDAEPPAEVKGGKGGQVTVTWTPGNARCPGGDSIYTNTDLSGCVGNIVELDDNVCYTVSVNLINRQPDGDVTVIDSFDNCDDACDDINNRGFPCP